jgi:hypothetical protein
MYCHRSDLAWPGALDLLAPELGAALGVAEGAFFLHPHGARAGSGRRPWRSRWGRVAHHDEVGRVAPAGPDLAVDVGAGLHVVGGAGPVALELAVLQRAALCHGVQADPVGQVPAGSFQISRCACGARGWSPPCRRAGGGQRCPPRARCRRRWAGRSGERAVAGLGDLAHQQVDVVDHVVDPGAARVLVEAHGPVDTTLVFGSA